MKKNIADVFESYVNWIVLFMFFTSINLVMEASAYLVSGVVGESLKSLAHWPARAGSISILVAIIISFRFLRNNKIKFRSRNFMNEFVTETIKKSAYIAFFLTLVIVAILDVIANDTQLPADFFIKLAGITLTAGFSISFFCFNFLGYRQSSDERLNH